MNTKQILALLAVISVLAFGFAFLGTHVAAPQSDKLGGSSFYEAYPIHFGGGLYAGANKELSISSTGNISISGASTSTISVGCLQLSGTSSVTAVKAVFVATTTLGTSGIGYFAAKYGTCP